MGILSKILVGLVAVEHFYILYLEMFAWTTLGKKTFKGLDPDLFEKTKTLAANQGLYNGFLSAGLIWSLLIDNSEWAVNIGLFFSGCVVVAGVYGALTASRSILYRQAFPAFLAMVALWLGL